MARKKLSPYQRIVRNAEAGRGTYLTPEETWAMRHDDAIATAALNDDECDEIGIERGTLWLNVHERRRPDNG